MTKKEIEFKVWQLQQTIASYDYKMLMSKDAEHIELLKSNQKKVQDELFELIKEHNKTEQIKKFFNNHCYEIEYFKNPPRFWEIANNFQETSHYNIVYEMIELYDNIGEFCSECETAKEFIFKIDTTDLSDNTMGDCLKVSYFHCVGAIIEWLQHIGNCY